ncbi:anti-sigma factor [Sphingomonas montanisoli]|uniref:Anti-sigma K factor RskA C-terminal domain-containing protein n=1 Tax=Sphingomonas montanisoli TaxID=2606412 RepID=A0A5D9CBP4_9SPHN|nr:anti-sigma factor [Sphingomonas montanisoli]TZG28653.1 hypothetical protein FYJ91_00425 [Sphingomonas montanisoli]
MADNPDLIAGEFVLGTLETYERQAVALGILTDPAIARAVADWQSRLAPALLTAPSVDPSPDLWRRIERATAGAAIANDNHRVAKSERRWQFATAAAAVMALLASGLALRGPMLTPPPPITSPAPLTPGIQSIAALSESGGSPALLVTFDQATGQMRVMPVNLTARPGHSLELWAIMGKDAPKSLGVMPSSGSATMPAKMLGGRNDATIAVSLEPVGGSPTGLPTGPVLYSGSMVTMPVS